MRISAIGMVIGAAGLLAGCATSEVARFQPKAGQQALVRDGRNAIVSKAKGSIVLVSPAQRQFQSGARPVFVVGVTNLTNEPANVVVRSIRVVQKQDGKAVASLPVKTYDDLVSEERTRQVFAAVLTGAAAGANAVSASQAGYGTSTSNVYATTRGPYGTYRTAGTVQTSYFDPTANAIARANASAQNEAMIANTIEAGQRNMASLEQSVIKDHSVMPGEWYGGQLHFEAPRSGSSGQPKTYSISILVGSETHEVEVVQEAARG